MKEKSPKKHYSVDVFKVKPSSRINPLTETLENKQNSGPLTSNKDMSFPLVRTMHKKDKEIHQLGKMSLLDDGNEPLGPEVVQELNMTASDNCFQLTIRHENSEPSTADTESMLKANEELHDRDNDLISPFPPVDFGEIDKHRHLNEEAQRKSKTTSTYDRYQDYLRRLELQRKQASADETKEVKAKKKTLKPVQPKLTVQKEINDIYEEKPSPPPKPKEVKSIKLILGFRYSYAIEQYYRENMKNLESGIKYRTQNSIQDREEVLNGWVVKELGPNVLNMQARTLPSCNPIELRLRRQLARMRSTGRSRRRTWSNSSVLSAFTLQSRDSPSKLNTIAEGQETPHSEQMVKCDEHKVQTPFEREISTSQQMDMVTRDKIQGSELVLPPIRSHKNSTAQVLRTKK